MKQLLYNEKKQAERIFNNGFTNGYDRREVFLVAKHIRHVFGYGDARVKSRLIEFCQQDSSFNPVTEMGFIKEVVRNSKNDFIVRSDSYITRKELDRVRLVKNFQAQKVYISLLAFARKNHSNFVSLRNWTYIKRISNLNITNSDLGTLFHILYKNELIYPIRKKGGGGQKILFMDWEGLPEISIKTDHEFYELGKTYERYCGGWLAYCEDCGTEFIRKNPSHKLCDYHSTHREKNRKR